MKRPTLFLLLTVLLAGAAHAQTPAAPAPATAPAPTTPRAPAANYVVVGNVYYSQGKYDQAYVAFREAVELDSHNTEALLGLGRSQVKLRLYAPAIVTLKLLTQIAPQDISGYIALSQAYQQQYIGSADRASVKGNLTAALGVLKDAEALIQAKNDKLQPKDTHELNLSKVLNDRGNVYRLMGDAGKATDAFKQASTLNPDNSLILFNLGDMYAATGNYAQAISTLQQAVMTDPRDAYNRAYYAKLLALTGDTAQALPEAAQAAKLDSNNAYAVGQYGVVSYLAQKPDVARNQLNKAVALDPLRYPEFYFYLGRLDIDANDLRPAREELTKAVALASNSAEYAYYLGLSYERSSPGIPADKLKARENYQRALKLSPNYQAAQDGLSRVK